MKVAVLGLWHLGTVTAACMAAHGGHDVTGIDEDAALINRLSTSRKAPVAEPLLDETIAAQMEKGNLRFSTDFRSCAEADVLWVAYDTPVDDSDNADYQFVIERIHRMLPFLKEEALVLISSQLPVGSTSTLAEYAEEKLAGKRLKFAYSPENLRLGRAIQVFSNPDRIVVGLKDESARPVVAELFGRISENILWMTAESAEMTKHALNAFLGLSIAFINEIGAICEGTGAEVSEVERGLKSEERIGPKAYLKAGGAFSGGTLARDIQFLNALAERHGIDVPLLNSVMPSNEAHKQWAARRLRRIVGDLSGQVIAVLGLTYKPGTDTLRRSASIELCQWLVQQGSTVHAHDPLVRELPATLAASVALQPSVRDTMAGASALVLATEWPEYRNITADEVKSLMARPVILDANGYLQASLGKVNGISYVTVGRQV